MINKLCEFGSTSKEVRNMRRMQLGRSGLQVPVMAIGVMHINKLDIPQAERF